MPGWEVTEKLPNFPYGKGYYEEMYNIWYNKYDCDEVKAGVKVKRLKAQMVQKLIFEPLVQYARIKASNGKTIDDWFKPQEQDNVKQQQLTMQVKEKPKHEIKIKKSKQLKLDAFL